MESVIADGWAARTCSAGRPGIAVTSGGGTSRNENSRSAVPSGSVLRSSCLTWWQRLAYACEKLTMACALASQNAPIVAAISSWAGAAGVQPRARHRPPGGVDARGDDVTAVPGEADELRSRP